MRARDSSTERTRENRMSLTEVVPILHFLLHFTFHRFDAEAFKSFLMTSFVCLFSFLPGRDRVDEITCKHNETFSGPFILQLLQRAVRDESDESSSR